MMRVMFFSPLPFIHTIKVGKSSHTETPVNRHSGSVSRGLAGVTPDARHSKLVHWGTREQVRGQVMKCLCVFLRY